MYPDLINHLFYADLAFLIKIGHFVAFRSDVFNIRLSLSWDERRLLEQQPRREAALLAVKCPCQKAMDSKSVNFLILFSKLQSYHKYKWIFFQVINFGDF